MGIVGIKEIRSEVTQKWFIGESRQVVLLVQLEFQEFGCSFFLTNVPVFLNASFLLEYPHNSVSTTISHNWHLLTLTPQLCLNYLLGIQYFFYLNCISCGGRWEGGLRWRKCTYTYGWITLLCGRNHWKAIILQLKNIFEKYFLKFVTLRLGKRVLSQIGEVMLQKNFSGFKASFLTKDLLCASKAVGGEGGERVGTWAFPTLKLCHLELGLCKMRVTRANHRAFHQSLLLTLL